MINMAVRKTVDTRRFLLGAGLLAGLAILSVGVTRAVVVTGPDLFEINDANVVDAATPTIPDWASLFDGTGQTAGPPPGPVTLVTPVPGGGITSQFSVDPLAFDPLVGQEPVTGGGACNSGSGDPTVYTGAGGEKNGDVLSTDTWGAGSIPNNKDDLSNVYAAAYDRGDGKLILFFGLERVASNGSAHVDFEFYHSTVGLVADSPDASNGCEAGHFTGSRTDGDIIITMDFDQGGAIGNPEVRRFNGTTNKYVVIAPASTSIHIVQNTTSVACGSWICRNTTGATTNTLIANAFVEGFLDTGDPNVNFTGCLSSFNVHTRSSPSFTATLKDFALGSFNTCGGKSGSKYVDANGDGSLTGDTKYTATGGWNIRLYKDGAGGTVGALDATDTLVSTLATDSLGNYSFPNLSTGTYFACEETKTGWIQTYPNAGTANPTGETIYNACNNISGLAQYGYKFVSGSTGTNLSGNNFGNFQLVSKGGSKFVDANGDGSLTGDSKYIAAGGWNIRLYKDDGGTAGALDATDTLVSTQATAAGDYSFTGIGPGTYFVCEETKTAWQQTYPNASTANPTGETIYNACNNITGLAQYGYTFTTSSGVNLTANNFGNAQLFRLIILTCSEASGTLVVSTVDDDGNFVTTTGDQKDTIGTPPALSGKTDAELQAYLCNLGGAQYNNLAAADYTKTTRIPKP
jgi:hypothetical protein